MNNLAPTYRIAAAGYEAVIASYGGGVKDLNYQGKPLVETFSGFPPLAAGLVLAPWPNRIADGAYRWEGEDQQLPITEPARNNAIHGLVSDQVWECVAHEDDFVEVAVKIPPQQGYPWYVRMAASYQLDEHGLQARFSADSPHEKVPYAFGWHTYLSAGGAPTDECRLTLNVREDLELDPTRKLPTGKSSVARFADATVADLQLDHCFSCPDGVAATLVDAHGTGVRLECSADLQWAQVFTPNDFPGRGRAIAVEPMSAPPNSFATGDGVRVLPVTDMVRISHYSA